jgi:hypothetical protein
LRSLYPKEDHNEEFQTGLAKFSHLICLHIEKTGENVTGLVIGFYGNMVNG